jgi:hypothetical protein
METTKWIETKVDMDSIDWKGNPIHLKNVPALQNSKTGKIRVYPSEVAKAEVRNLAKQYCLETRDVALLLLLYAKPGNFEKGKMYYQYHVNKSLFYLRKELEKQKIADAFPMDEFEAADRGPVPKNLEADLKRLTEKCIISTKWREKRASKITELTPQGLAIAEKLWEQIADPIKVTTLKVKEWIFPLDPRTIHDRVHKDYPEYKKTYTKEDTA